jgi:hypothetical protein
MVLTGPRRFRRGGSGGRRQRPGRARSAEGIPSDPPLRATRQRRLQGQHCARQGTDGRPNTEGRAAGIARHGRSRRHYPSSSAMPLLRRPHDHCRGLCARCRTARPATVGLGRRREPTTGIAATTGRLNKIFRPQNRGAVIQTLPATNSSEDDPRSLRFSNGF